MNAFLRLLSLLVIAAVLCQCESSKKPADVVVSVADQKMGLYRDGQLVSSYRISTSKFGLGDKPGSNCTPLGRHEVVAKIGHGLPSGAVLKSRQWNGEVVKPNAPGRDPIVSRILWLNGCENSNHNAYGRCIYIHGTTEEFRLGQPASYGCVRMAASDVIRVFERVPIGASVLITKEHLPHGTTDGVTQRQIVRNYSTDNPTPGTPAPKPAAPRPVTRTADTSATKKRSAPHT